MEKEKILQRVGDGLRTGGFLYCGNDEGIGKSPYPIASWRLL